MVFAVIGSYWKAPILFVRLGFWLAITVKGWHADKEDIIGRRRYRNVQRYGGNGEKGLAQRTFPLCLMR